MIQVYEYFISHHLSKAFESVFGSVTCLPGCFCMYRIRSASGNNPLLISPGVIRDFSANQVDTLHLKNLLHLGEDRFLTTLMMKHFPNLKLTFSADAKCKTNAPARWEVLVSQRRRWINSTVHTLLELMTLKQLCGCCMFSMRAIVVLDLISTCVQPSAIAYVAYLIYEVIVDSAEGTHLIALIMIGIIYGGQMLIFILKGEFQHMGWMIIVSSWGLFFPFVYVE
jgi:chitin synthase